MAYDVVGYGGGGKSSDSSAHVATEAPDSLRSKATAKVLDLICEGPIKGLVNGYESIFLDDTPLMNSDGILNFQNVGVDYRLGTQAQTFIPGFASTESEIGVSVQVKASAPVVRTIDSSETVDAIRVTLSTPRLTQQDPSNGDLNGSSVTIAIDLDEGGGYVQKILDDITGKTTTTYQRNYTIELTGPGPHTIRVRRVTADSTSSALLNDTYWDSYTLIEDGKLRYPNSALMAVMVDASQFQSIPTRAYDLYLREIRVPTNYDPIARTYAGVWDGSFKVAWTDNPAWCWMDLATSTRFGLGNYVTDDVVDKWALYQISQYCDELVPDGRGGMEPRFTCNVYLQTREEAYKVISNMASVFRGIVYWGSTLLSPVQDAPSDPVVLFSPANVVGGEFAYTGSDLTTRHTAAIVQWNDPGDAWKQKFEYVEGEVDDIQRYGMVQTQVVAMGCTSQGQANRVGRWTLYSEANETEIVAFSVSLEGALCRPGQIIQVQDPSRATVRLGGRIMEATESVITLDASINVEAGKTYEIYCMLPNPPDQDPTKPRLPGFGKLEIRPFTAAPGLTSIVTVDTPFSEVPQQFAMWIVAVSDLVPQTFRVLSVTEDNSNKLQYDISAVSHNPSKFAHVDFGTPLQDMPITRRALTVPSPILVNITQHEHTDGLGVSLILSVNWTAPAPSLTYKVQYKKDLLNWVDLGVTGTTTIDIPGSSLPGQYTARVVSINVEGKVSPAAYSPPYTLVGKTELPAGLDSLAADSGLFEIDLFWTFSPTQQEDGKATNIYVSRTNDFATVELLIAQPYPQLSAVHSSLQPFDVFYYWGAVVNTSDKESPIFPSDPLGGIKGEVSGDAKYILQLIAEEVDGTLAGRTVGELLGRLDDVPTGFSTTILEMQSELDSFHTRIDSIGARLDGPDGDIASAISRIESTAAVVKPTPQLLSPPADPVLGDAYYDMSTGGAVRYWNGLDWILQSTAIPLGVAPSSPTLGELWLDTSNSKHIYRIWNGAIWIPTARVTIYALTEPSTTGLLVGDTWKDLTDGSFWVFDGTIWVNALNADVASVASRVTSLQTQVNDNTSQIRETLTSIAGIAGLWSVVVDINGHVSGLAFSSELVEGSTTPRSAFVVNVDDFAVGDPDHAGQFVFVIRDGKIIMDNALIGDADIDTLKIKGNAVTIPVAITIPGSVALSSTQTLVASASVSYPVAPMEVVIDFQGEVSNGGGGNGATQTFVYRNGSLIDSGQDPIVNNINANRALRRCVDAPGPGDHLYEIKSNYAGPISSASMIGRTLIVSGAMR